MSMSEILSFEWLIGVVSLIIQIILAGSIIYEQNGKEFFGSDMSIPIRLPFFTRIAQLNN